jgi:hypothetical protein
MYKRIYFGGQTCNLIDLNTNQLYQNISENAIRCKLDRSEVGIYNASILVNGEFGRSLTSNTAYYITPDEKPYNFLSYARNFSKK